LTDIEEKFKEISIDGKIYDLKKYHQYNNTIQKSKLIICEGLDDLYFLNYFLKSLDITDIEVRYIEGKFEYKSLSAYLKIFNNFNVLKSLALVCDADDISANEEFNRLKKILNKINKENSIPERNLIFPNEINRFSDGTPKIGVFIFPNNKDKGRLEDLFLSCVKNEPEMECVNSFMDCVSKLGKMQKIPSKAKTLAYLAAQYETRRGVGGAAREGIWEFKTDELNEVKNFIENL